MEEGFATEPSIVRGEGYRLAFAGALTLAVQNAALLAGFLLWLESPDIGFGVGSASLILDVPGILLLSLGIRRLVPRGDPARWAARLGMAWAGLTVSWRWALPATVGRTYADLFDGILAAEGPAGLPPSIAVVVAVLGLWIAASVVLAFAAILARIAGEGSPMAVLLGPHVGPRSWEGFLTLSAIGTGLVAWQMLVILGGGIAGGPLTAGLAIKVVVAPLNGVLAYGLMGWRAHRARLPTPKRKLSVSDDPAGGRGRG